MGKIASLALVLAVSLAGASVLTSDTDESGLNQTITGINGTDTISFSVDNDTLVVHGFTGSGVEVFHARWDIQEK